MSSRWHAATCQKPEIFLDTTHIPRCRTCDCVADPHAYFLKLQEGPSQERKVPKDEASGTKNYYWPPKVPYVNQSGRHGSHADNANSSAKVQSIFSSSIHERRLRPEEIRLAVVTHPIHLDHPIHISLRISSLNRATYNEYDTASYTWGGQEENVLRDHPIYVGDYWDISLQTKNCWSLFRYLRSRPNPSARPVWVDAVCINQTDVVELTAQVAKMRDIFKRSQRVLIFLGPEFTQFDNAMSPKMRDRRSFEEILDEDTELRDLKAVFEARYFTRVWVIQELLCAPHGTMLIDHIEFEITPISVAKLFKNPEWARNVTKSPWLKLMMNLPDNFGENLLAVLHDTRLCEATDLRDKVFGILGLIQDEVAANHLRPDYSITFQHTKVGIFAYILLVQKNPSVLKAAAGLNREKGTPSWLPDWPHGNSISAALSKIEETDQGFPHYFLNKDPSSTGIRKWAEFELRLHVHYNVDLMPVDWNREGEASIDASSSALTIRLIRLFRFYASTRRQRWKVHSCSFEGKEQSVLQIRGQQSSLFFRVPNKESTLKISEDTNIEVFVLLDEKTSVVLFMKPDGASNSGKYHLVRCYDLPRRHGIFISTYHNHKRENPAWREIDLGTTLFDLLEELHESPFSLMDRPGKSHQTRQNHLGEAAQLSSPIQYDVASRREFFGIFPRYRWTKKEILPILQGLCNQKGRSGDQLQVAYITCLLGWFKNCQAIHQNGFIQFRIDETAWPDTIFYRNQYDPMKPNSWQFAKISRGVSIFSRNQSEAPSNNWARILWDMDNGFRPFYARYPISSLERRLGRTKMFNALCKLSPCTLRTNESESDMIMREPNASDDLIYPYDWPEAVINDFEADGVLKKVEIL